MDIKDFHWLVGILEGEGCFSLTPTRRYKGKEYQYPKVCVKMTDEDVVDRAARLMGGTYYRCKHGKNKDSFEVSFAGSRATRLMKRICPFMGKHRQARIAEILSHNVPYIEKLERIGRLQ